MTVAAPAGGLHHVELWVPDLAGAVARWGWLLTELGWSPYQDWPAGRSWRYGATYVVLERSRDLTAATHERTRPGLNHLALWAGPRAALDRLRAQAPEHGWAELFADRYPYAGGPDHVAAYLVDADGFEVELAANPAA